MNLEGSVFIHSARPVHGKDPGKGSVGRNCKGEPKRQEDNDFWKYLFRLSTYKGRSTVHRAWNSWATADKEKTSAGDRSYSWSGFEAYDYEGFYFQDRRQRKRGFGENENQHTYYKQKVRLPQGIRENLLLLDLDPTCLPTVVQAKEAFMKFAMHNHPDRYADDPIKVRCAEENFKKVNAAYHSLLSQISTFTTKSP